MIKTTKEYLDLMPPSKWTDMTVRGKLLHDIIDTSIYLILQKKLTNSKGILRVIDELYGVEFFNFIKY